MLAEECVRVTDRVPSFTGLSTAVTVTVWAEFQLDVVNVNDDALSDTCAADKDSDTVTELLGFVFSTTVYVDVPDGSATPMRDLDTITAGEAASCTRKGFAEAGLTIPVPLYAESVLVAVCVTDTV